MKFCLFIVRCFFVTSNFETIAKFKKRVEQTVTIYYCDVVLQVKIGVLWKEKAFANEIIATIMSKKRVTEKPNTF